MLIARPIRPLSWLAWLLAVSSLVAASTASLAAQPHMETALAHLEQALGELKQASSDKGGNRADAIRAVERAIAEVRKGIDYDRTHQKPAEMLRR